MDEERKGRSGEGEMETTESIRLSRFSEEAMKAGLVVEVLWFDQVSKKLTGGRRSGQQE
jgi:hypothetical protein